MEGLTRPTWVEIDLDKLVYNYYQIKKLLKPHTKLMAVVKGDAYEHGLIEVARVLIQNRVNRFAVATLSEAIQLRKTFKDIYIMILGYTPNYLAKEVINNNIIQTIYCYDQAELFSKVAVELGKEVVFHIKIETGMNRLGLKANDQTIQLIAKISNLANVYIEGIFTHFPVADTDKNFSYMQAEKLEYIWKKLKKISIDIPIKHISNSAAIIDLPEMNLDMVRPGIILYGIYPSPYTNNGIIDLKNTMSFKTQISHVKEIDVGEKVGYGLIYEAKRKTKIATLPVGFADGYSRLLTGKGEVIAQGKKVPVIGNICMDQCMIDVTGLDVNIGEECILFGSDGKESISIEEVAKKINVIPAVVINLIKKRVPKVYIKNNRIVKVVDYLLKL